MYYEVYIDVVFATNLLMDYILLRLVGTIFRAGRTGKERFWLQYWEPCFPVSCYIFPQMCIYRQ